MAKAAAAPRPKSPPSQPSPALATTPAELPRLAFADARAFSKWLAANHSRAPGVWLQLAKKASGIASVTYLEALDEALCFGWIDGLKRSYDESSWLQKFTPRARRSIWSKINRDKALALIKDGRMKPAGQAEIDRAQADGRWAAAYDSPKNVKVPDDLVAALAKNAAARKAFEGLNATNRYAILFRIHGAKRPETRVRRIATFVQMLAKGDLLHP